MMIMNKTSKWGGGKMKKESSNIAESHYTRASNARGDMNGTALWWTGCPISSQSFQSTADQVCTHTCHYIYYCPPCSGGTVDLSCSIGPRYTCHLCTQYSTHYFSARGTQDRSERGSHILLLVCSIEGCYRVHLYILHSQHHRSPVVGPLGSYQHTNHIWPQVCSIGLYCRLRLYTLHSMHHRSLVGSLDSYRCRNHTSLQACNIQACTPGNLYIKHLQHRRS